MSNPLRSEARPAYYSELDLIQRKAFRMVVRLLHAAVNDISRSCAPDMDFPGPKWLDRDRRSRLAFISGDRGTGKSTAYLSVVAASLPEGVDTRPRGTATSRMHVSDVDPVESEVRELLKTIRGRVVFLEPIDMERLPGGSNLLAAILTRLENELRPASSDCFSDGLLGANRIVDARLKLHGLQTEIAMAWRDYSDHAMRCGDLENDAADSLRLERARMRFQVNLREILDELAKTGGSPQGITNPIYVVPIDDFDLNPSQCLEILQLARMISVPRLFLLMVGDVYLAEDILRLSLLNRLSSAVGATGVQFASDELRSQVERRAESLARAAVDKLLPEPQMIHLSIPTVEEAAAFRPVEADDGDPTLREALDRFRMPWKSQFFLRSAKNQSKHQFASMPGSISDFLQLPSTSDDFLNPHWYEARIWLRAPWRRLTDFYQAITQFPESSEPHTDYLPTLYDTLRRFAVDNMHNDQRERTEFDELIYEMESDSSPRMSLEFIRQTQHLVTLLPDNESKRQVRVYKPDGWFVRRRGTSESMVPLHPGYASLMWMYDFRVALNGAPCTDAIHDRVTRASSRIVSTRWRSQSESYPLRLSWPIPLCQTFWQSDQFHYFFEKIADVYTVMVEGDDCGTLDRFSRQYAHLILRSGLAGHGKMSVDRVGSILEVGKNDIKKLIDLSNRGLNGRRESERESLQALYAKDSLIKLGTLLLPHYGLSSNVVNELLDFEDLIPTLFKLRSEIDACLQKCVFFRKGTQEAAYEHLHQFAHVRDLSDQEFAAFYHRIFD